MEYLEIYPSLMNPLKKCYLSLVFVFFCCALSQADSDSTEPKNRYNQLLFGYGTSHPGWGETTERVQTLDLVFRHARIFKTKEEGWLQGNHEFWIETPVSILLSDSDSNDANDLGMVGLNFLFAWVFPETKMGSPYLLIGGGPQYIVADIDGVGSDLCGNYQMGCGLKFTVKNHPVNLELRYHHISNLGMEEPNIPLNSTKLFLGFTLPF